MPPPRLYFLPCLRDGPARLVLELSLFTYIFKVLYSSGACFSMSWPRSQNYCALLASFSALARSVLGALL